VLARNVPSSGSPGMSNLTYVQGDVLDVPTLVQAMQGVDGVFHLAGSVTHSRRAPESASMVKINHEGVMNVLEAAKAAGIARVVYSSTSGTIAVSEDPRPISDEEPFAVETVKDWPYYRGKVETELALAGRETGAGEPELVCMRPSLLLGPGDERMSSCSSVNDFLNHKVALIPSGGLNFVDVRDCAKAFIRAMQIEKPRAGYLIGSHNMTLKSFFQLITAVSGVWGPFLQLPDRLTKLLAYVLWRFLGLFGVWEPNLDPVTVEMSQHYWYIDAKAAKADLDFDPRTAEETVKDTVDWLRDHAHRRARKGPSTGLLGRVVNFVKQKDS